MINKVVVELNANGDLQIKSDTPLLELSAKSLMLYSAAQCAGVTLLALVQRYRATITKLEISVSGTLSEPFDMAYSVYEGFDVRYVMESLVASDCDKLARAVEITHDKYCGVMAMLRHIAPVDRQIEVMSNDVAFD